MPPHCDSLDGPVVTAARKALDADDVTLVLPFVPEDAEAEVRSVFESVRMARVVAGPPRDVADRLFFETVVRLHRAGEGAPYEGLKPAGLDVGPVIPLAERAIDTGSVQPLMAYLTGQVAAELERRLAQVRALARAEHESVGDARAYVEAMLGFEVWSHHLWQAVHSSAHEGDAHEHAH
jgi:hypothetical protein